MATLTTRVPERAGPLPDHANLLPLLITLAVGLVIWFIPPPEGVDAGAWHLLAIFVATIVGIIAKPLPMGAVAMIGIMATAVTGILSIGDALSGFSNSTIWLIVSAFFISRGFIKTGLGERIAYYFMSILGKRSIGLAYGLIGTDLVLAPAIPSNTARGGGVVYPVLRSLAGAYGSEPDDGTAERLGAFLVRATFQGLVVTSAMFLTAMAANPLAVELAGAQGVEITWARWAIALGAPALLAALVLAFFSNLFAGTTHYGTGPAPVLFGSGYVEMSDWWKTGALISVVNIAIWLVVGGLWWGVLGIW